MMRRTITRRRITRRIGLAAVGIAVTILAGCSGAPQAPTGALTNLQSRVFDITEAASQSHYSAALTQLDALEAALGRSKTSGNIQPDRAAGIQANIDLVRTDLKAAIDAAGTPAATQKPETGNNGKGKPDNDKGKPKKDKNQKSTNGNDGNNGTDNDGKGNETGNGTTPEPTTAPTSEPSQPTTAPPETTPSAPAPEGD